MTGQDGDGGRGEVCAHHEEMVFQPHPPIREADVVRSEERHSEQLLRVAQLEQRIFAEHCSWDVALEDLPRNPASDAHDLADDDI